MNNTGIISFNSASKTNKMLNFKDIKYINLQAILEGKIITDFPKEKFFEEIAKTNVVPSTSQPTTGEILSAYEEMLKNYKNVLVLTPEKTLSGTFQNSDLAKEMLEIDNDKKRIHIIETRSFAFSEAILCDRAIDMIKSDEEIEEIKLELNKLAQNISTYIIPGSFNYLKKVDE